VRLAINATVVESRSSGLGVYTRHIVRELAKLLPDLVVFSSAPEILELEHIDHQMVTPNVRGSLGRRGHLARFLWAQSVLPRRLKQVNASVLLAPTPMEAMIAPRVPQVVTIHDLIPLRFPEAHPRQRYFYRFVVPRLLRRSAGIVAVSNITKMEIVSVYGVDPNRITVIHNGCDRQRFTARPSQKQSDLIHSKRPYILYVGNLLPHKNLHRLIEAFARIAQRLHHHLIIVGHKDARYFPELQRNVNSRGIGGRVTFLGFVSAEELTELYRSSDWFVLPSLFEGFGMPPIEAMACGTPVIVSSIPALRETVAEAGIYFDPEDIAEMSERILMACADNGKRAEFREKGLKRAATFDWSIAAGKILTTLQEAGAVLRQ
jgi:glycosyltransferase involved in cell wall biosynthesis